jgi:poly(A) polymerase
METLHHILRQARIFPELTQQLRPGEECYLVGGALRDWRLGRESADFDFATPFDPTDLAKRFAGMISGAWFFLDGVRRQSRIVVDTQQGAVTYDFAPFRGPDLDTDLNRRDFTINAIAFPLGPAGKGGLVDPLGGQEDLKARRIRACSAECLREDPLRILKGARHAVSLGFAIEPETVSWMQDFAPNLSEMAPERKRNELAMILEAAEIRLAFSLLRELNLFSPLFGHPGARASVEDAIDGAGEVEAWARFLDEQDSTGLAGRLFREPQDDGFSRLGLLKLAAFMRGYKAPAVKALLAEGLRLSRSNCARVTALVGLDADRAAELDGLTCGPRGKALWAASFGSHPVECVLFLGALVPDLRSPAQRVVEVLRAYLELAEEGRIPDLVNGDWIRDRLGLSKGPLIGKILARLRREEIAGGVQTREDAEKFVRRAAEIKG